MTKFDLKLELYGYHSSREDKPIKNLIGQIEVKDNLFDGKIQGTNTEQILRGRFRDNRGLKEIIFVAEAPECLTAYHFFQKSSTSQSLEGQYRGTYGANAFKTKLPQSIDFDSDYITYIGDIDISRCAISGIAKCNLVQVN
jgi:hypothetical protein